MSERRWGIRHGDEHLGQDRSRTRSTFVALLLAALALIALDATSGSPIEPLRRAVGAVYGPAESGTTTAVRPFTTVGGWFRTHDAMREDISPLEGENASLRSEVRSAGYDRNRLREYDGLTSTAASIGYALVPARVVGYGPAQSFTRAVTIDAGTDAGIHPDMTVVNGDGLVGRVLRVTASTATVLLAVDADSTVGGRVGASLQVGFLQGRGSLDRTGRMDLELVDQSAVPAKGDSVVTWGSDRGAPYVSGIPIGAITSVYSSVRDTSQRAVVEPYVDFGALDVVGVVVPSGTRSDRGVIEADGSLR